MTNFLKHMYAKRKAQEAQIQSSSKNPNRVTGGLKAQGVDRFTMVAEDGSQKEIPTVEYVRSLEEQSKKQRAAIDVLERKLTRLDTALQQLQSAVINRG